MHRANQRPDGGTLAGCRGGGWLVGRSDRGIAASRGCTHQRLDELCAQAGVGLRQRFGARLGEETGRLLSRPAQIGVVRGCML